jgi:hypothetical protein
MDGGVSEAIKHICFGPDVMPSVDEFARNIRRSRVQALGHVVSLWLWALENAPDGDLSAYTEVEIAGGASWIGEPTGFVKAMKDAGLIDSSWRLVGIQLTAW